MIALKVFAKLASTFLLAWLFASPAMACLLPIAQLSQEEKACCRGMAGMCGEMGKNSSHSCCVKAKANNPSYVVAKASSTLTPQFSVIPFSCTASRRIVPAATPPGSTPGENGSPPSHSPPNLPDLIAIRI
jgi:hypothetical protein